MLVEGGAEPPEDLRLQLLGVLIDAYRAKMRKAQVPAVGFEAHGAGRDRVTGRSPPLLLQPGEPPPSAVDLTGTGFLPPPVAVDRATHPVSEGFLGNPGWGAAWVVVQLLFGVPPKRRRN